MVSVQREINYSWWILRIIYGITFIGAGIDKFFYVIVDWRQFVHPSTEQLLHLSDGTIVCLVGVVELAIGIVFFTKWVKTAALLSAVWLIANGFYLAAFRMYLDTAARYCVLGIVSLVFFHLTRVREKLKPSRELYDE